jgi:TetR/AcrR family transcriptional regulator, cholesterol catabolism regulator
VTRAKEPVLAEGKQRRRTRPGKAQQERLIEVAARMFHERGYDATSLQDIADELGLLKGSLYHYIASKDDLLWAVILKQHESSMALAARCRELGGTPTERLEEFVRGYAVSLRDERDSVSVYLREIGRLSEPRRKSIHEEREQYVAFVRELLDEGVAAGEFRKNMDTALVTQGILGMLNSTYRWYRPGSKVSPTRVTAELFELILGGVVN